jgi:hypothetical protein
MSARPLSWQQRAVIRQIAENPNAIDSVAAGTYKALVRRGIITAGGGELTPLGRRVHAQIMESGDGPEQLKSILSRALGGRY